jgi:SpoVK/Ycf46/Vps4 family AAA+-type ATPase
VLRVAPAHEAEAISEPDVSRHPGPVVLAARTGTLALRSRRPVLAVQAEPLAARARRRMWRAVLPGLADSAALLAARGVAEPGFAAAVAADVHTLESVAGRQPDAAAVAAAVRARAGLSLAGGVKLIRPTASWADLVLPRETERRLREAADRLQHQTRVLDDWGFLADRPGARGVRVLLSGPPGTGKTLSAEVLAHELGVDLLLVDIARIVSKWIGETEKNLAEVFDAAERSQAVLFFDEADALFGRRTEVSDAHDRYANLETAYLLTRLERFEGLAVLSTNLRQNVDPAFLRRLEFVIELEEPARPEREALWRCHLPDRAPVADDVDVGELASRYPLVGGLIRNAAVAAGFLAAADGGVITRTHLDRSLRREYEKSGRPFPTPAH